MDTADKAGEFVATTDSMPAKVIAVVKEALIELKSTYEQPGYCPYPEGYYNNLAHTFLRDWRLWGFVQSWYATLILEAMETCTDHRSFLDLC